MIEKLTVREIKIAQDFLDGVLYTLDNDKFAAIVQGIYYTDIGQPPTESEIARVKLWLKHTINLQKTLLNIDKTNAPASNPEFDGHTKEKRDE